MLAMPITDTCVCVCVRAGVRACYMVVAPIGTGGGGGAPSDIFIRVHITSNKD